MRLLSRGLTRTMIAAAMMGAASLATPALALDYLNTTVQPDRAVPSACMTFSTQLPRGRASAFEPYVAIDPETDHSLETRGKDLCIGGLQHGKSYNVRIKAGLPGADGTTLAKDVPVAIQIPDRQKQVFFDQGKTLLPYTKGVGLPLKSVNVTKAHITLYRFSDRTMVDHLFNDWFGKAISFYDLDALQDRATKLFDGSLAINSDRNKQVSTTIPIEQLVKTVEPGVYVVIATSATDQLDRDTERATQWFSVSDIGLTTVKTDSGLLVSAHSLKSAQPLAGVDLKLVAQSNEALGTYKTDGEGRVVIPGGLLRGTHADAPKILSAQDGTGGFTWIQLDTPALDLSDLDIKGRAPPLANDAFLWTDRGVYRPGETIHIGALLRDHNAALVENVPLTLHIVRPDGIEVDKKPLSLATAGGGTLDIPMAENAVSGTWKLWASAGDKTEIGSVSVSVQDFVPPRLEAKVSLPAGAADLAGSLNADIAADYFYGSPGADLTGTVEATLQASKTPFKALDGYSFGLAEEPFLPKALANADFTTDDKGKAQAELKAEDVPDTTSPLELSIRATVNDVDGRPAVAETTQFVHTADRFIGVKPGFTDLPDGGIAKFDVVLVDGDGKPLGSVGLKWNLVKEDYDYNYFYKDGRWQSNETVTSTRVNGGELALDASGHAGISAPVTNGRWRLEAYDSTGKTATSLRFEAGWWAATEDENRKPEVMPVSIDAHPAAGKVRAMVETNFAGRVLVMLDGNGLHGIHEVEMKKGGAPVEFDVADVPASGAYVLAIAISPSGAVVPRLPARAVGLAWVPGATAAHKLDVALTAPATIQPKTTLAVDVDVKGAPAGGETYVTLAAVDEAVLRMTDFATPDSADHFLGRRAPDFELRDVYNSLIDPAGQAGQLTQGGDGGNANLKMGGLDVKTFKTVALFKGPVKLDAAGHATIKVDVPDFSGRLRVMAQAWSADRFGKADRAVTVRPPLLAELTLPRFLAPGDKARVRLMLTDLEAPEQTYNVAVTTKGAISFDNGSAQFKDTKRDKRRFADRVLTASAVPGVGRIHMDVTGADGTKTERDFEISVRTPNAYVANKQILVVQPGQSVKLDDALGTDLVAGTGTLDVTASTLPAFDVTGLLADLRRYPYGCAEQTISRAFPELLAKRFGAKLPVPVADTVTGQGAIQRLYSLQGSDGSFGYWTSFDTGNFWLTAYAVDFMQHARAAGLSVPEGMETRATNWLAGQFANASADPEAVAGAAYAAIVLSRAQKLDLSQLRYVATRVEGHLPSDISRVQLAAAMTRVGEKDLAIEMINAPAVVRSNKIYLNDYGSAIRDQAMAIALAAEEKLVPEKTLIDWAEKLSRQASGQFWLSTQEQTWLLRAAFALHSKAPLDVTLNGKSNAKGDQSLHAAMPLGKGKTGELVNNGDDKIYVSLATTGIPSGPQKADANGFSVSRSYYQLDGSPADLKDVHQNDELVVVVSGNMSGDIQRKVLAVDMLPAGLEPETIGLTTSRDDGQFAWLKDLTEPTFYALRDDRYMAGVDLRTNASVFKFAYVVRAVTPGTFVNPGPQVEDMYAPAFHARGDVGVLEVKAARAPGSVKPKAKRADDKGPAEKAIEDDGSKL